jgi:hypothetical protein
LNADLFFLNSLRYNEILDDMKKDHLSTEELREDALNS